MAPRSLAYVYVDIIDIGESKPDWTVVIDVPASLESRFRAGDTTTDLRERIDATVAKCTGEIEVAEKVAEEVVGLLRAADLRAMTGAGIE